jgi:DNA-binding transcriptional LysR family regulator
MVEEVAVELRALRCFVAVADSGSVSLAAQRLHTAQPSLSRQLQRFEAELGLTLFDRNQRRLVLSPAGRRFLPVARDLVTRAELARDHAAALREGAPGSVVLSAPQTTATDVVAPFLATWGPSDPLPTLWEAPSREAYAALDRGADLAIGAEAPPRHLERLVVADLPVWAYVRADHHWASRSSIALAELGEERLLVLEAAQHSRIALERALGAADLPLGPVMEFRTAEVAQAVAATGRGVAVVSDDPRYDLVPVGITGPDGALSIRLHAVWSRDHYGAGTLRDLATRLREFSRERYGLRPR